MERLIWWIDMVSALVMLITSLYVVVVFADLLSGWAQAAIGGSPLVLAAGRSLRSSGDRRL